MAMVAVVVEVMERILLLQRILLLLQLRISLVRMIRIKILHKDTLKHYYRHHHHHHHLVVVVMVLLRTMVKEVEVI